MLKKADIPDYDAYRMKPEENLLAGLKIFGVLLLLSFAFYDSWIPALVLAAPALFLFLKRERVRHIFRRKELLKKQFLSAGDLLSDYLRSGYAVENAMKKSLTELRELWGEKSLIVLEWETILHELSMGNPIEDSLLAFSERVHVPEIRDFAEVFSAVKRTGGQIGEVLGAAAELISDRFRTEEQIRTMITQKRLEQHIMDVMPAAILLFVRFSAPEMVSALYTTLMGRIIMTGCLGVYVLAAVWAEKIIQIDV